MDFAARLSGRPAGNGNWHFDLAEEMNGGFGGTNGGCLAAICVFAARDLAPDRLPIGVDARFIRGFRPGPATVVPTVLNAGRTLTTVCVDVRTDEGKLATRGTVSLVAREALAHLSAETETTPPKGLRDYGEGKPWRHPSEKYRIPLIDTFSPAYLGRVDGAMATASKIIWDGADAGAEAACIAADISVGPPVARHLGRQQLAIPNPDLSLRFTGSEPAADHLVSLCRLDSLDGGLASTSLQVWSGECLIATGISTTTVLKGS